MHTLLQRQLRKMFGSERSVPADLSRLLVLVDAAYRQFDQDRIMLERSLDLSSQELLQANQDIRAVLRLFPELFFRLQADGTVLDCNMSTTGHLQVAPGEVVGRRLQDVVAPEVGRLFEDALQRVKQRQEAITMEYAASTRAASLYYEASLLPLQEEQVIVLVRDISERKQAEEEVRRQAEQLRRTVEGAVLAMSLVVETRDPYTAGHERRVSELATAIAKNMGMEGEALTALRLGGLIHDIGKIAVPAEILAKPGRLSEIELNIIKQHSASGFDILGAIDFGLPIAEMVLQHHERQDGSGYPRGLSGEDILPEARILAVADVVEAMSSHRPYRAALGMAAALAEVKEHAGVKYDADVVATCVRLVEEQGFAFTV